MSLDLKKIRDFGDTDYKLIQEFIARDGHLLVDHGTLISKLREVAKAGDKADRLRAVLALRYAAKRKEGLVQWTFNIDGVARKDLISWAEKYVQGYFSPV